MVARVIDLKILAQTDDARRQLDIIAARADAIGKLDPTIKVRVDAQAVTQGLAVLRAETAALAKNVNVKVTADGLVQTTAAMATANALWTTGAGRLGALAGRAQLFGGVLTKIGIPAILATAGGLHILIESVATLSATLIPAGVALGVFGVAAIPTVQDLVAKMTNLNTVTTALGVSVYPLTGGFQKLAAAVQPQVYTLFGEALYLVSAKTGELSKIAAGAGTVLDQLGARAVAALTSSGLSAFLAKSVADLATWGDLVGNLGGVIGNVLKALPGYAGIVLSALDGVSKALETVSGFAVPLLQVGLQAHGAFIWIGLLATAATFLVTRGLGLIGGLATSAALGLGKLGAGGSLAARGLAGVADGAAAAATLPWGWILIAAAGLAFLAVKLISVKDAAQQFNATIQQTIQNAPLLSLGATLLAAQAKTAQALSASTRDLSTAVRDNSTVFAGRAGILNTNQAAISAASTANREYATGQAQLAAQSQLVNSRISELSKAYGGNAGALAALNGAGITSAQITDRNNSHWAAAKVQIAGYNNALLATAVGTGRVGAANNALGNDFLTNMLPALQKVTAAEDALLNNIVGGRQAWLAFEDAITGASARLQTPAGLAGAASVAGAKIGGLNAQSQALANAYYGYAIPSAQKLIDALQQQNISTGNLTTAVATEVAQMLPFTKGNSEARSVLVDLINNALGPGTVSLQTLNKWVGENKTTLTGFNAIVAKSTIAAGNLANTLSGLLNVQFHNDLLAASGASAALKIYTADLVHNQQTTDQGKSDRQRLITDLENAGLSAKQATAYVNGLTTSLGRIPKTEVSVIKVTGKGTWTVISPGGQLPGGTAGGPFAAGGLVYGAGGPTQDNIPIMASAGEYIVKAAAVHRYGPKMFDRLNAMSYASGGVVGGYQGTVPGLGTWAANEYGATVHAIQASVASATAAGIQSAIKAAIPTGPAGGSATPGLMTVARYMMSVGASAAAAAGIAGTVAGESGGDPEAVQGGGGGGMGLIQWTPGSSARPYQPIITGNAGRDMAVQLVDAAYYIAGRGGMGRINAAGAAGGPMSAAWVFSGMEAPAVAGSDIRPTVVAAIYAALTGKSGAIGHAHPYDAGGLLPPGLSLAMNRTGRAEVVAPGGVDDLIAAVQDVGAAVDHLTGQHTALMDRLTGVTASQGSQFAGALTGAARTATYRALYPG